MGERNVACCRRRINLRSSITYKITTTQNLRHLFANTQNALLIASYKFDSMS